MKQESLNRIRALSAMVAAATLAAACGGGSDDAAAPPPVAGPPPAPATVAISGKAVDGALQGAIACYDTSNNGACESTEPTSVASGVDGSFTIPGVPEAAAGQHRVIVRVPVGAFDADSPATPIGKEFVLIAPATGTAGAQSVFVSPLTTLVQRQMDAGQSKADAVAFVQTNLALAVSPLADFTASSSADNVKAANAARLVVATQNKQAADLVAAVGQTDVSGSAVTQPQIDAEVAKTLGASLSAIGSSAADPSLAGKTGAPLVAAVGVLATGVVAQVGLTVPEVVAQVGVAKLPPEPVSTATPTAGASLSALRYASASDWTVRSFQSTAADNTVVNGLTRSYELRTKTETYAFAAGSPAVMSWAFNNDPLRAGDQWWSGSAWTGCPLGTRNPGTPRDANGRSNYDYCNGYERGTNVRAAVDIAGQTLASVLTTKIRVLPGGAGGVNYANWGPTDLGLLGTATFPPGSVLHYQTTTPLESAIAYDVRDTNIVSVVAQAAADGGDARVNPSLTCNVAAVPSAPTTSLEEMIARSPGKPCVFNAATNADGTSGSTNESWGITTVSLGTVTGYFPTLPAGTGNFYTNDGRIRVSFTGSGNGTVYYACYTRRTPLSTRNCQTVGTGTYTIATLGDARVMTLNNVPVAAQRTNFARVFVERSGKVYHAYKNPVGQPAPQVRLNMTAANAMLAQLQLPVLTPTDAPAALTGAKATNQGLMKGVWSFTDAAGTGLLRVGDNGEYLLASTDAPGATFRPGYERGWLDVDAAGKMSRVVALDTDGDSGLSHFNFAKVFSITDTTFRLTLNGATEGFDGRLPDSGSGIVGMWALGSATDLKVTQFVFFGNGKALSIHPAETTGACATARQGPPGIEWSDYSFNATTRALRIYNKIYDTSGCTGVFDSSDGAVLNGTANTEGTLVLTIAADGKTATFVNDDGVTMTLHRITPNP